MSDKFRLQKIDIRGFRGFRTQQSFDLSAPFILVSGPNGSGKSSFLTAIEWCIYGDQVANINRTGLRERKNWAIVNKRSPEAEVTLTLESGEERVTLTRNSRDSLVMEIAGGTKIKKVGKIWSYLGAELEDFFSSVHLHQESIRDLIISRPGERRESFYRLLGLSNLQNTQDAIGSGIKYLHKNIKDRFTSPYLNLEARLEARWKDLHQRKEDRLQEGARSGLTEKDFSHRTANKKLAQINKEIRKLANQFKLSLKDQKEHPEEKKEEGMDNLEKRDKFLKNIRSKIRKLRNQNPSTRKLNKIRAKKAQLEEYKNTFENLKEKRKDQLNRLKKVKNSELLAELREVKEPKDLLDQIQSVQDDLKARLSKAKKSLRTSDSLAGLVSDALRFIEDKEEVPFCPVCGQPADKSSLTQHLHKKRSQMGQKKNQLSDKISALEKKLKEIKKAKDEIKELSRNLSRLSDRWQKGIDKVRQVFDVEIRSDEDPAKVIDKRLTSLDKQLAKVQKVVNNYNQQLDRIEDEAEELKVIEGVLKLEEEIDKFSKISINPAVKKMRKIRIKAYNLVKNLGILHSILEKALNQRATSRLNRARDDIGNLFTKLTSRQGYPNLTVDPVDFEVLAQGGGEDRLPASTLYNQGDLNQAALSIFLGLAKQADKSHHLGFVILDDPSQSLDRAYKKSLAEVINDEVARDFQVLISTMDREFMNSLKKHIVKKKNIFNFEGWSPEQGPEITVT